MPNAAPIPSKRRYPPIFWGLLILLFIMLGVGIGATWRFISARMGPPPAMWAQPWRMPEPQRINSGMAVWSLAGASPEDVYRQAITTDEFDAAAAMTLLTARLPSAQRLGWIQALARQAIADDRPWDASVFLHHTSDLTLLLTTMKDYQRAQRLIDVADGWLELGDKNASRNALEQALTIAQFSTEMRRPVRRKLLTDLANHYIKLGDAARGQAISAIPVVDSPIIEPQDYLLDPLLLTPPAYSSDVENARQTREQAARAYVDDWNQRGGAAAGGAVHTLGNALIDEDLVRQGFYESQLQRSAADVSAEILQIRFDQINWIAIKYRVASGLYGASLVANWEAERPAIAASLDDALQALHSELAIYVTTLPAAQQAAARVAVDRLMLEWAVIGLYSNADLGALTDALNQDIAAWPAAGVFPRATMQDDRVQIDVISKTPPEN